MLVRHTFIVLTLMLAIHGPAAAGIGDKAVPLLDGTEKGKVLYTFTGARSSGTDFSGLATIVTCTNTDKPGGAGALVGVEFFGASGQLLNDVTISELVQFVSVGHTRTFSTQSTSGFADQQAENIFLFQGSGRVISTSTKLICSAHVVDSSSSPPTTMMTLPVFRKTKQGGQ